MTRNVATVAPGATYKQIVGRMHERGVSALPVVDAEDRVVGIVSEADLVLKEERPAPHLGGHLVDPHGEAARARARTAAALMTSPVVTVGAQLTLTEAARLMHQRKVRRLPVVDAAGVLVGIVSRADLLAPFLRSDESLLAEVREDVLAWTLAIDPDALAIGVEDGVVRVEGQLETRSLARILVRLVAVVEGVVGVDDRLSWRLDDTGIRPGTPPLALRLAAGERR